MASVGFREHILTHLMESGLNVFWSLVNEHFDCLRHHSLVIISKVLLLEAFTKDMCKAFANVTNVATV